MEDYYAILGVPPTASEEQIKQAYRRLIKVWHPDVCTKPNAHEQSVKIIEAHKILSDPPQTRGEYDRLRRYGRRAHTHGDRTAYSNRESAFAKTQEAARRHAEEFVQKNTGRALGSAAGRRKGGLAGGENDTGREAVLWHKNVHWAARFCAAANNYTDIYRRCRTGYTAARLFYYQFALSQAPLYWDREPVKFHSTFYPASGLHIWLILLIVLR